MNCAISQLRFFTIYVLHKPWDDSRLPMRRFDEYLPYVPSQEEVWQFIPTMPGIKQKAMVALMYSFGLRIGEVCILRYEDIRRKEMRVFIRHGKNRSSRYAILSKAALDILTQYWFRFGRPMGYLFPKQSGRDEPIDTFFLSKHIHAHERRLGWPERITCHSFRHAFGTHLYENGTDLPTIKALLGHKSIHSTVIMSIWRKMALAVPSALLTGWEVRAMHRLKIQQAFDNAWKGYAASFCPSPVQGKAAASIMACKSGKLGVNASVCRDCGHVEAHNNSCRNRSCPCCQAILKEIWIDARRAEVIDAPYFHVVFTVLAQLNALVYANQALLYSLLHRCSAQTLLELAADRKFLGAVPGIIQVPHTWGQQLNFHPTSTASSPGAAFPKTAGLRWPETISLSRPGCSLQSSKGSPFPPWTPFTVPGSLFPRFLPFPEGSGLLGCAQGCPLQCHLVP